MLLTAADCRPAAAQESTGQPGAVGQLRQQGSADSLLRQASADGMLRQASNDSLMQSDALPPIKRDSAGASPALQPAHVEGGRVATIAPVSLAALSNVDSGLRPEAPSAAAASGAVRVTRIRTCAGHVEPCRWAPWDPPRHDHHDSSCCQHHDLSPHPCLTPASPLLTPPYPSSPLLTPPHPSPSCTADHGAKILEKEKRALAEGVPLGTNLQLLSGAGSDGEDAIRVRGNGAGSAGAASRWNRLQDDNL